MAVEVFADDPTVTGGSWSTLASGYTSGATSLTITSNTPYGSADPTATPPTKFRVRIDNELFVVTDNRTTTWTVSGAAGGSAAANHASGATVTEVLTASSLRELQSPTVGQFGDGSDGAVTISSGTTTLTRDMFYTDLTVASGATLKTAGYRVYCTGTLSNSGTISNAGANGSGATGGAGGAQGTLPSGGNGGNGATGNGSNGTAITQGAFHVSGGAGNGGAGGTGSAGTAGGLGVNGSGKLVVRQLATLLTGYFFGVVPGVSGNGELASGGPGAGGGGGDGTNSGGGGGGGGGALLVVANKLTGNGVFSANGGNGANGVGGNSGGGGGGCAGWVLVTVLNASGWTGTLTATPGSGGTKTGTGSNGANATGSGITQLTVVATP